MGDPRDEAGDKDLDELNPDGAGAGASDEPNTFEPEEEPEAVEDPKS